MTIADWLALIGAVILFSAWVVQQSIAGRRWAALVDVLERVAYLLETDPAED